MSDQDMAASHIDQLENRLTSLHELGVDTAGLRSQLAFARTQLHEGRIAEALGVCEDVAATARRLADGSEQPERPRTGRFTRDQLGEAVRDLLSQGLFAKLMAEHRGGPDVRLEARLNALEERLRTHISHEADALRAEQQVLREEMEQVRRSIGTAAATPSAENHPHDDHAAHGDAPSNKEPLWAARLHSILVKAIRRSDAQAAQIASIVQQITDHATSTSAGNPGLEHAVTALRSGIAEDLRLLGERQATPVAESAPSAAEPAWSQALGATLQAVLERLQSNPSASTEHAEPAWSQGLCEVLHGVGERLQAQPLETTEPSWSHGLRAALEAVATRLATPPVISEAPVAAAAEAAEPTWALSLREALVGAEARHQALLAAMAAPTHVGDTALGDQLAGALERGLHDLGTLLVQRPARTGQQPMDDSHSALSPVSVAHQDHTTREVAHTTTRTDRLPTGAGMDPDLLRQLVAREVQSHLGTQHTEVIAGNKPLATERIRALVSAELDVRHGGAIERTDRNDVVDLRATLLRLLPELLNDDGVRQSLFAVLALEAVGKPGVLSELTGLRAFLRRELSHAAEDLATKLQPV